MISSSAISWPVSARRSRFGVNVLSAELATAFATRGLNRFGGVDWSLPRGIPRLD